ncbi:hypothetical protein GCM10028832_22750 [Streptomyces sparsus]
MVVLEVSWTACGTATPFDGRPLAGPVARDAAIVARCPSGALERRFNTGPAGVGRKAEPLFGAPDGTRGD